MNMLDQAINATDKADLIILSHVETIRDQMQPATPSAVASLIGGAPVREIAQRLQKMYRLQIVDSPGTEVGHYALTELGVELLRRELIGWSPSAREDARRTAEIRAIVDRFTNGSRT